MPPRPSTRHDPAHWQERGYERPPDEAEASKTPPVPPRQYREGEDPNHRLDHQAKVADPDSDGDPYADAEAEGLTDADE
ncbi:MAG TPA: hypothetical protein VGM91_02670 [Conexibacter sp.]|jgi:hypothetical protein